MPAREYIIRYREYRLVPGTWDKATFSFGDWPYDDWLRPETIEDLPDKKPRSYSIHFCFAYSAGTDENELRRQAKDYAREKFRKRHPDAKLY